MGERRKKKPRELMPQQRAALITWRLVHGGRYTTAEVAEQLGITYQAARYLLTNLSGAPIPIYRDEKDGRWQLLRP